MESFDKKTVTKNLITYWAELVIILIGTCSIPVLSYFIGESLSMIGIVAVVAMAIAVFYLVIWWIPRYKAELNMYRYHNEEQKKYTELNNNINQ
jgi:membrane protein YdbS with pleckstrin-like domain